MTDEEFQAVHAAAGDRHLADFLLLAWETGMRSKELRDLRAGQVHLDVKHIKGPILNFIHLGVFDSKNGTERVVPLSGPALDVIRRRMKGLGPEDWLLTNDGEPWGKGNLLERFETCCKRGGVMYGDKAKNEKGEWIGVVFHDLRHSRISRWIAMGFSDEVVRKASGHKSLETFKKYVHLEPLAVMRLAETRGISEQTAHQALTALK